MSGTASTTGGTQGIFTDVIASRARYHRNLADDLGGRGGYRSAVDHGHSAVKLFRELAQEDPVKFNPELALSLHELAYYLRMFEEDGDAAKYGREAVELLRGLVQDNPDEFKPKLAVSLFGLTFDYKNLGDERNSMKYGREALRIFQDLDGSQPGKFDAYLPWLRHNLS